MRWIFGIDFSRLSKIGFEGIEFYEQREEKTINIIAELEASISDLTTKVEFLQKELSAGKERDLNKREVANFEGTQTVSKQAAQLAKSFRPEDKSLIKDKTGFIWIGNFNQQSQKWDKPMLAWLDGKPLSQPPQELQINTQFKVLGNMILRDGQPQNDTQYYRSVKSLGVIPQGTIITLLEKPIGIDREFAMQYWVKVEVNE